MESRAFLLAPTKRQTLPTSRNVAFAEQRFDGYVSFIAKTQLIDHYKHTLGAVNISGQLMVINTNSALKLIDKYFKK